MLWLYPNRLRPGLPTAIGTVTCDMPGVHGMEPPSASFELDYGPELMARLLAAAAASGWTARENGRAWCPCCTAHEARRAADDG